MDNQQTERLKKFVNEEFPEKLTRYRYYNGECYCAIGALMAVGKHDFDFNSLSEEVNKETIETILYAENEFSSIAKQPFTQFGLTEIDLISIQSENDEFDGGEVERANYMKNYILDLVKRKSLT